MKKNSFKENNNILIKFFILNYKLITKNYIFQILFFIFLTFITIIFYYLYIQVNPYIIDESGNLEIFRVSNEFGNYIKSIFYDAKPKLSFVGIDLYSARRPILPYYLLFVWNNITQNFLFILLIKNIFFGFMILYTIKNFSNKKTFLLISLILIYYNPHNSFTMLDINYEEGFLNYFIIILFFLILSKGKYKSILIGVILSAIFFTKDSTFIFTLILSISYIFFEKNKKYIPLIIILLSNLVWGFYTLKLNNNFAIGPTGSSFNTLNLANVYQEEFIKTYPQIRPDINYENIQKYLQENNVNNEEDLNDILIKKSIKFFLENPSDVVVGIAKKIYVISFSPFKDGQYPDKNGYVNNPIRYSNFPNKLIFNLSLFFLFYRLYKKSKKNFINLDFYYLIMIISYFIPYMIAFVYPRHCTPIYIISHLYVLMCLLEKYDFINKVKILK